MIMPLWLIFARQLQDGYPIAGQMSLYDNMKDMSWTNLSYNLALYIKGANRGQSSKVAGQVAMVRDWPLRDWPLRDLVIEVRASAALTERTTRRVIYQWVFNAFSWTQEAIKLFLIYHVTQTVFISNRVEKK